MNRYKISFSFAACILIAMGLATGCTGKANGKISTSIAPSEDTYQEDCDGNEDMSQNIVPMEADVTLVGEDVRQDETTAPAEEVAESSSTVKIDGVQRLLSAYPDKIKEIRDNTIFFADGTTMIYDDGKIKDFETMLDNADPEDMFHEAYNKEWGTPGYLQDVGRSRSEQLYKKLYGATAGEVQKQLVSVPWFGGSVKFSSSNGAAEALKKVKAELDGLVAAKPELKQYLKSSGTFYWRNVRGANRLSAHSYGIAFDIGVDKSDYWRWKNPKATELTKITYHNRIPREIVEVFEKYGFVWGGKWYHFDTMHFEYRPELNPPSK